MQPGAARILAEARTAAIVGGVQRLEAGQGACRFAQIRRLRGADAGQANLAEAAVTAHVQAQGGVVAQGNGAMAKAHEARDRQACARLVQACGIQTELLEQGFGADPVRAVRRPAPG